ncbi:MAG: mechanosensitive ion channel, partial [Deltaproteobacteria bacterium]|nr:mechanosensitive ion channel [Deltaproteobacteria bacterium]
ELKAIADSRNALVGLVFQRDSLPMWSLEFWDPMSAAEIQAQLVDHEKREQLLLSEYWDDNRSGVVTYLVLSALLGVALIASRDRVHKKLAGDDLAPIRAIFDRPISLAMLISFFVALFTIPEIGRVLAPVLGAASLIPAVLILRQIVDRPLFPLLNLVVGVYFIHQLREIISPLLGLYRLTFTAETLILLLVCGWWLRPSRLRDIPREMARSWLFRCVGYALRSVFFLSAVGLAANLVGYGALANLIGSTLIWSTYAAVVLYGASRVPPLVLLGMVSRHRWLIRKRTAFAVHALAWYLWATATLRRAELLDNAEESVTAFFSRSLPIPEVEITFGDILAAALTFYAAMLLSRFIRFLLAEDIYPHLRLAKGRPYAISTLLHYILMSIGFVLATIAIGFDMNRFTLLAGAFGVGIGFGLQTIVNNFLSGIILLTERPVEVGDTIALGEIFGEVKSIGIRSSTVRTWQGAEVIVPNADLIAQQVTNWTKSDRRRRIEIPVGVAYGSDPRLVLETLLEVGKGGDHILAEPEPYVLFQGFGDSSLDFELRAWTDEFDSFLQIRSQLCTQIAAALEAANLVIPFPQRDLHIHTGKELAQASTQDEVPLAPAVAPTDDTNDRDRSAGARSG